MSYLDRLAQRGAPQPDRDAPNALKPATTASTYFKNTGAQTGGAGQVNWGPLAGRYPGQGASQTQPGPAPAPQPTPPPQPEPTQAPPPQSPPPMQEGQELFRYVDSLIGQYGDSVTAMNAITGGQILPPGTFGQIIITWDAQGRPISMTQDAYNNLSVQQKSVLAAMHHTGTIGGEFMQNRPTEGPYAVGGTPPPPGSPGPAQAPPPAQLQRAIMPGAPTGIPVPPSLAPGTPAATGSVQNYAGGPLAFQGGAPQADPNAQTITGAPGQGFSLMYKGGGQPTVAHPSVGGVASTQPPPGPPAGGIAGRPETVGPAPAPPPGPPAGGIGDRPGAPTPPAGPVPPPANPQPDAKDPQGLPISSEFLAAQQAAADQLAAELQGLNYEETQIGPMVNLMLSRLQEDEAEDMRRIEEEMNARGLYDSGIKTHARRTRGETYGRQRTDVALDTSRRTSEIGMRRQQAQSNHQRTIANALMALAKIQAQNPATPGGTANTSKSGKGSDDKGKSGSKGTPKNKGKKPRGKSRSKRPNVPGAWDDRGRR